MPNDAASATWLDKLPLALLTTLGGVGGLVVGLSSQANTYVAYALLATGAILGAGLYFGRVQILRAVSWTAGRLAAMARKLNPPLARSLAVTFLGLWGMIGALALLLQAMNGMPFAFVGLVLCGPIGAWVILRKGVVGVWPHVVRWREERRRRGRLGSAAAGYPGVVASAESVMTLACGAPVELRLTDTIVTDARAPHLLLRCAVAAGPQGVPASVVLKQARSKRRGVFNEWASLVFAGEVTGLKGRFPTLHGGDRHHDLLVMEDLGAGPTLQELLMGGAALQAEAALVEQVELLAQLHAASAGRRGRLAQVRSSLTGEGFESDGDLPAGLQAAVRGALDGFALSPPAGLDAELATVSRLLAEPGTFDAFLLRDTRPGNWLRPWLELRPCDLERSCFGLATLDLAGIVLGHLAHPAGRTLPPALRHRLLTCYRETLARELPVTASGTLFDEAWSSATVWWLGTVLALLPVAADQKSEAGEATARQRFLAGLDVFLELPDTARRLPCLAQTAEGLRDRAHARWGEGLPLLPTYPAFNSTTAAPKT